MIGGEEIKAAEGESLEVTVARLEREKKTEKELREAAEKREKATREEFEAFKKNV